MDENNTCLICNSQDTKIIDTEVSEFLEQRVFDGNKKFVKLIYCKTCGFAYYDYRMTDEDNQKLYKGYRDENYQKQRQSFESWYSKEINQEIGSSEIEMKSRAENLTNLLTRNIDISLIKNVLDYGGDRGQHIPKVFNQAKKYCYDISGVKTVHGVENLTSFEQVQKNKYDFVMCAHVLEHVSNPDLVIKEIKKIISNGGYLYIELPFDNPFFAKKQDLLQFLFNKYFPKKELLKKLLKMLKEKYLFRMNEHINYFSPKSAQKLIEDNGFEIIENGTPVITTVLGSSKTISVLARINN